MSGLTVALIVIALFTIVLMFRIKGDVDESDYENIEGLAIHKNGEKYVGSGRCITCHPDIYNSHINTAHFKSSAYVSEERVMGSLENPQNYYQLNDSSWFIMSHTKEGIFQDYFQTSKKSSAVRYKMDIIIGSGRKGQSYASWKDNELFQLPLSYFTPINMWTISPGLEKRVSEELRPVNAKCLECHATFAKSTTLYGMGNTYDKSQILLGIDCERCHGPAYRHVVYHESNRYDSLPKHLVLMDTLSRDRQMDLCALCHSGIRSDVQPSFEFVVGDNLRHFSQPATINPEEEIDVHGNQVDLLKRSECFINSASMNCATCHDSHKDQHGDRSFFNQKCISCHQDTTIECQENEEVVAVPKSNCIACHMPMIPSKSMAVNTTGTDTKMQVEVRTHLIKIYAEELWEQSVASPDK